LLKGEKKYEGVLELGTETDTQDPTGTVIAKSGCGNYSEEEIRAAFKRFEGTIEQEPPIYSALKHEGVPLYKLARKGKPVRKPARKITISQLEILDIGLPEISFWAECSAGTYIRTLASDIGRTLGCGGYLKKLKRTESSGFSIREALTLDSLEKLAASGRIAEKVIPMADALRDIPGRVADGMLQKKIVYGQPLDEKDIKPVQTGHDEGFVKIVDRMKNLLAVVKFEKERRMYDYCCVFPQ
jgi:tRNA pseudouridine55 synthase